MSSEVQPLACPTCARKFPLSESFCPNCRTPLVYVGRSEEEPVTGEEERAGRVRPEYTGGGLVKVAYARNIAEAEMIQGILLSEGIPSVERRTRGFDVPDFLAGGPRDILVPGAAEQATRQLLADLDPAEATPSEAPTASDEHPLRFALWFAVALVAAVALVWAVYQLMV